MQNAGGRAPGLRWLGRGCTGRYPAGQVGRVDHVHGSGKTHKERRWLPYRGELEFAAGLARMAWTEESVRAAVREADDTVFGGKLVRVLEGGSAYLLLRHVAAADPALYSLRRLVDVLATAAERSQGGHPEGAA